MSTPPPPQPPQPPIDLEKITQLKDKLCSILFGNMTTPQSQITFHHERDYAFRDLSTDADLEKLLNSSRFTPASFAPLLRREQVRLALQMLWYEREQEANLRQPSLE